MDGHRADKGSAKRLSAKGLDQGTPLRKPRVQVAHEHSSYTFLVDRGLFGPSVLLRETTGASCPVGLNSRDVALHAILIHTGFPVLHLPTRASLAKSMRFIGEPTR